LGVPSPPLPSDATLRCRECGRDAPPAGPQYCEWCFSAVEVVLPDLSVPLQDVRTRIGSGPRSLWRYEPLLPAGLELGLEPAGEDAGWTPLVPASTIGTELGIPELWVKDETANPTGSFKDRVVEVAGARGLRLGQRVLACSSTGNLARAVAGAAARRSLPSVVLVPAGLDRAQVRDLSARGATVVAVRGGYDAASRLAAEAAGDLDRWAWVNVTLRPWYELGARTVGWEIAEQLGWRFPDRVVVPMASGALARAVHEAMAHLAATGLVAGTLPKLTVVQPAGCAGVAEAFASGAATPTPVREPDTVAESLAMGDPPDGDAVLAFVRSTGGVVHAVAEDSILEAAARLRTVEGLAVEPAGGVVVAALADLAAAGVIEPGETVVAVLTGAPREVWSDGDEAPVVPGGGLAGTIEPSVSALTELLPAELLR
jgi:threonine synthase